MKLLLLLLVLIASVHGRPCPNTCSGHGTCQFSTTGGTYCVCDHGWNTSAGPDCSLRECPFGTAWHDFATDDDTAHGQAECSNMGTCNRETGQCVCNAGFEGDACERMACPSTGSGICNGKGKCMSLREAAVTTNGYSLVTATTYTLWDADKIYGCVCDAGYKGYDCSQRECKKGMDTVGTAYVTEIQIVDCTCPATCSGYFYLGFLGEYVRIYHYDDDTTVKRHLETLSTIPTVDVSFIGGTSICDADGVSTTITFRNNPGDQLDMVVHSEYTNTLTSSGGAVTLEMKTSGATGAQGGTSRDGDAPIVECSGRGLCSTLYGHCTCQNSGIASTGGLFSGSDGEGGQGSRDDCGYDITTPTGCVLADDGSGSPTTCAGHGTCDGTTFTCNCDAGYTGHDCTLLTCPGGAAWFDEPSATNTAHATMECSNRGICDRTAGTCTCQTGFTGSGCEKLACPGEEETCNGHGTCMTMKQLALLSEDNGDLRGVTYGVTPTATTWDHSSIQGCYCDQGVYHGPFANDFSDWTGSFDCLERTCPFGDNPQTIGQSNEVQTIQCIGTGGTFTITFRQDTTLDIPYNADEDTVKFYLEQLFSIFEVTVTFSGAQACAANPGNTITLAFKVPGDLPLVTVDTSSLTGGSASISEATQGTTEYIECSGQGVCDRTTGICKCFAGYVSSDGSGDGTTVGQRGDCGAMYIFATTQESGEEATE